MTAEEVRTALYGRPQSARLARAGFSVGSGQDLRINVGGKEDWYLSHFPVELDTSVSASLRVYFDDICERCRESCLEVPEDANKDFSLALGGVYAIAEREGTIESKNAAVVARDSAVKKSNTVC